MDMDLISREAAISAAKHAYAKGLEPSQYIEIIPSVTAVPLDKLCEWLSESSVNFPCIYCKAFLNECCYCTASWDEGSPCPNSADDWRRTITEWMEEQDADRE